MRFFITLEIPENSKKELDSLQTKLKTIIPEFKISDSDKLHLTIAFIGEQPDNVKGPLTGVISKAVEGIPPFSFTPAYIDGFPHLHNARIIWIGVKGDIDKLHLLRHRIKDGLQNLNLDVDERRFIPHIALGKLSDFTISAYEEVNLQKLEQISLKPIFVGSIKLFESIPHKGFHEHNTLAEIKLV